MNYETVLILHRTIEECECAMDKFTNRASDLELAGQIGDAADLRELVGKIQDFIDTLHQKHA